MKTYFVIQKIIGFIFYFLSWFTAFTENLQNRNKDLQDRNNNTYRIIKWFTKCEDIKKDEEEPSENRENCVNNEYYNFPKSYSNNKKETFPTLVNYGANYYLNSALLGLAACRTVVEDISRLDTDIGCHVNSLRLLHQMIQILNGSNDFTDLDICNNVIFLNWNCLGYQDAFDLMSLILTEVYSDIQKFMENKRIIEKWLKVLLPLRLITQKQVTCVCKSNLTYLKKINLAFHIPLNTCDIKNASLQYFLDKYFEEKTIKHYQCSDTNCTDDEVTESIKILEPLPKTICIRLERNYWNGCTMEKIESHVMFGFKLTIKKSYIQNNSINNNNTNSANSNSVNDTGRAEDGNCYCKDYCHMCLVQNRHTNLKSKNGSYWSANRVLYSLSAVLVHYGSVGSGYHVCYKRNRLTCDWFVESDNFRNYVTQKEVLDCNAYLLFYEIDSG